MERYVVVPPVGRTERILRGPLVTLRAQGSLGSLDP